MKNPSIGMLADLRFWLVRTFVWRFRKPRFITLMGGPGAGKGTVATGLAPELGLSHESTGALMRKEIEEGTEFGNQVKDAMAKGNLVSDHLVMKILTRALRSPKNTKGVILDGFPRTLEQAVMLDRLLASWGVSLEKAVWLELTEDDLIERLSLRRICSNKSCGRSYHLKFDPPKVADKCDGCGSALIQRQDDKAESIKTRLATYKVESAPLRTYYQAARRINKRGTSCSVMKTVVPNNSMNKKQVLAEVVAALDDC